MVCQAVAILLAAHTGRALQPAFIQQIAQSVRSKARQLIKVQPTNRGDQHGEKMTSIDSLAPSLEQQQLVEGLKDVDGGLVVWCTVLGKLPALVQWEAVQNKLTTALCQ